MYKIPKGLEHYQEIFQKELPLKDLIKFFIGTDKDYRITSRDSYMGDISDPEVILEYGIYPVFVQGKVQVKDKLEKALLEMSKSHQALALYQVVQFLNGENMLLNYYESLPFYLNREEILSNIKIAMANEHIRQDMKEYKSGEFAHYKDSMLDMVERTIDTF
ncbi:NAD glycohydrolase inhibitor [Streptococcus didelphis]|uniref:NAD glycohydrolase inhibitor n=1 Tax=Streptococcus didelphis TaxID=102886 RepID=A0ABY9LH06_9STRE|nr:NAD glycohydrolase inhibitor [Streptococcus didelphis]WMB28156.1 NAD glycohydrolase inhibitor [Streptococcus didelphis]WMB28167.1 NAD glycohydrolase inhibitor [Streptococcus didelphis]WMB30080.1 NAD glycohydrolase inhibitor [Streptococcus didelphis]